MLTEDEWRAAFKERMVAAGATEETAHAFSMQVVLGPGGNASLEDDPEEAADNEMEYWEVD